MRTSKRILVDSEAIENFTLTKDNAYKILPYEPEKAYQAFLIWFESQGTLSFAQIGERIGVAYVTAIKWSEQYLWSERLAVIQEERIMETVKNINQMTSLQGSVVKAGYEDYVAMRDTWANTLAELNRRLFDPSVHEIEKLTRALKDLVNARVEIDRIGRTTVMLPREYFTDKLLDDNKFQGDAARSLDWGGEARVDANKLNEGGEG